MAALPNSEAADHRQGQSRHRLVIDLGQGPGPLELSSMPSMPSFR